jgi:hypothetical protein
MAAAKTLPFFESKAHSPYSQAVGGLNHDFDCTRFDHFFDVDAGI